MVKKSLIEEINNINYKLQNSKIENSKNESYMIFEYVTGIDRYKIGFDNQTLITSDQKLRINDIVKRRINGEPLQYIFGLWEFYGLEFKVGEGVLIPRQDTETLVDVILDFTDKNKSYKIVDLCSGSGCIAVSIDKNLSNCDVTAVEFSDKAFEYLQKNIKINESLVKPLKADVLDQNVADDFCDLDIVVSNPPYLNDFDMKNLQKEVTYEPEMALYAEDNGLHFYKNITSIWSKCLKENGILAFECGINQHEDIKKIMIENGFKDICFKEDLCGIIRVVFGRK